MEKGLKKFTQINRESSTRWSDFKKISGESIKTYDFIPELTPFYNTPLFSHLTNSEKNNFFHSFMQFNAEAIILLELTLYEGIKSTFKTHNQEDIRMASVKMLHEEKDHTKAYLKFLKYSCPDFPKTSFILRRNRLIKNTLTFFARKLPITLTIPGAKFEAYSVFYSQEVSQHQSPQTNYWAQLNHLHMLDETHHVNFEFDLYHEEMTNQNSLERFFLLAATFVFILVMQVVFLIGCYRMVNYSKANLNPIERWKWTLGLGEWVLREFPPYKKTRVFIKKQFENRNPILGKYFSIIYR